MLEGVSYDKATPKSEGKLSISHSHTRSLASKRVLSSYMNIQLKVSLQLFACNEKWLRRILSCLSKFIAMVVG